MKKYFYVSLLIAIMPGMVLGASARYTQLVREKQHKMEQLEKCMGTSKGLKIAGVSTLGLTAVGVVANVAEAKTIKTNEKTIEKKDKAIEEAMAANKEKADKLQQKTELAECKKELRDNNITDVEKDADGKCKILTCKDGYALSENTCKKDSSEQETDINAGFKNLCKKLNGEYTQETIKYTGNRISADVKVYNGCIFESNNNLRVNCDTLEPFTSTLHKQFIDESKNLCAYVGDAEWNCLNGESTCSDLDPKSDENISARDSDCDNSVWSERENYTGAMEKTDKSGTYTCNQNTCACYDTNGTEFQPFMYDEQAKLFSVCCRDCAGFCATASVHLRNH